MFNTIWSRALLVFGLAILLGSFLRLPHSVSGNHVALNQSPNRRQSAAPSQRPGPKPKALPDRKTTTASKSTPRQESTRLSKTIQGTATISPNRQKAPTAQTLHELTARQLERRQRSEKAEREKRPPTIADPGARLRTGTPTTPATHIGSSSRQSSSIQLLTNTSLAEISSDKSLVSEPTAAEGGNNVFYTANWFAAVSTDSGRSFRYVDPYNFFPSAADGFCCDQDTVFAPNQNLMVWLLQYVNNASGNVVRIAVTTNPAGDWMYYDFEPELIEGISDSDWFDYPHLSISNNFLYFTINIYTRSDDYRASAIFRAPLSELATGGNLSIGYYATGEDFFSSPAQGATTTMYWAGHRTNSSLRIFSWPESSPDITIQDVTHTAYPFRDNTCIDGDGANPCLRSDDRVLSAWVAGGKVGFLWNAARGTGGLGQFPFPYVHYVTVDEASKALVEDGAIWNPSFAFFYPSLAPNTAGKLGGVIGWAGGRLFPSFGALVSKSASGTELSNLDILTVGVGNRGPNSDSWGDYLRVRQSSVDPSGWVASGYNLQGSGSGSGVVPRYIRFVATEGGNGSDTTAPGVSVLSPVGGAKIKTFSFQVSWTSQDNVGVTSHDILLSNDGGQSFGLSLATGLPGTTQGFTVTSPVQKVKQAVIKVTARDAAGNIGEGVSSTFRIKAK